MDGQVGGIVAREVTFYRASVVDENELSYSLKEIGLCPAGVTPQKAGSHDVLFRLSGQQRIIVNREGDDN